MFKASEEFVVGKHNIGYVSGYFKEIFGNQSFGEMNSPFESKTLERSMNNSEIMKEFDVEELNLGDVLFALKNDEILLKNGHANIFYVRNGGEVFAVHVRWASVGRRWGVYAGRSDDARWLAGCRAFPRRLLEPKDLSLSNLEARVKKLEGLFAKGVLE